MAAMPKIHLPRFKRLALPKFEHLTNLQRGLAIGAGAALALGLFGWIGLNFALAEEKIATPLSNWGLRTFGGGQARLASAKLEHPFANTFEVRDLNWPEHADAKSMDITFDLLGFLPNHTFTDLMTVRDANFYLGPKAAGNSAPFNPQRWISRIDAKNVVVHYTRRAGPQEVTILSAKGSFAQGNVQAEATSGRSRLTFNGLARMGGGSLAGDVTATGENLKDLAGLAGASAPDTPPFALTGRLSLQDKTWSITNITGAMGASDLGGNVSINLSKAQPFLSVDLKSRSLDFRDLGVVFGIPIAASGAKGDGGVKTNTEQREAKAAFTESGRLIPNARIDVSRLGAVDADLKFAAAKVINAPAGVSQLTLVGALHDRVLNLSQVLVKTPTGDLDATVTIDARSDPAHTKAAGSLRNVAISRIAPTPMVKGTLNGQFALDMTGSGFREAASSVNGQAGVWSNDSEITKLAGAAAGLDLGKALVAIATSNGHRNYVPSRCLAGNIVFTHGNAELNPAVLDNEEMLILANGGVNLKTEAVDIHVVGKGKSLSLGKLSGDIKVKGTLRHPSVTALNAKTAVQAGLSALLSAITGPLAAIPFTDAGASKDAPCAQLLSDAKSAGEKQDPTLKDKVAEQQKRLRPASRRGHS